MVLITEEYRKQQEALHADAKLNYGSAGANPEQAAIIARIMNQHQFTELLDYGAGKLALGKALGELRLVNHPFRYLPYEPANPKYSGAPEPCEFVVCSDVLEHIEPDCLEDVLDDLRRVTMFVLWVAVHCGPAFKTLPDGRNAHLIQQPPEWWLPKLLERFDIQTFQKTELGFMAAFTAKEVR